MRPTEELTTRAKRFPVFDKRYWGSLPVLSFVARPVQNSSSSLLRSSRNLLISILLLYLVCLSCGTQQVLAQLDSEDEFERAMSYYEKKQYSKAVEAFERILFYHPSSEYVDDAQYWLARSYFEKGDYAQAVTEFDYLISNFKTSGFLEEAYLYRAKSHFLKAPSYTKDPTEIEHAINLFDQFLTLYPNSQYTDEVKNLILLARNRLAKKELENGKLYVKLGEYDAALLYFNYVIETYPETAISGEAKYRAASLYERKGQIKKSLDLYKELLDEDEWKEKAIKKIDGLEEKMNTEGEKVEENVEVPDN